MGVKYRDGQNYPETYEDYVPPGAVARCMLEMMDYLYPVGCYFETTDTNFDPNQTFGGTWELESGGLVHISSGFLYDLENPTVYEEFTVQPKHTTETNVDLDGGEAEHTLTIGEMPEHNHSLIKNVSYGIAIHQTSGNRLYSAGNGAFIGENYTPFTVNTNGGSSPHNNMQPYKIVNRWHRTA